MTGRLARIAFPCLVWTFACGGGNESQPPPQNPPPPNYYGPPPNGYPPNAYGTPPPGSPPPAGFPPPGAAPPPGGFPPGAAPPPGAPPGAAPPPGGTAAAPGGMQIPGLPPIPTTFLPPAAPAGPSAQPLDPNFAGAATGALNLVAASETAGMTKEGAPLAGNFQEGQVLEQQVTIQPGKCYTIVAAGVGVQELELTLLPVSPVPGLPSMGSSRGAGSKTVLGGGGNCIKLALIPIPVQAKWVLKASRGGGLAAGQLFVK